jgi:hypothetical protein
MNSTPGEWMALRRTAVFVSVDLLIAGHLNATYDFAKKAAHAADENFSSFDGK